MKHLKKILTGTAAIAMVSTPVFAGSLSDPEPTPVITPAPIAQPVGTDWTGGYAGVQLGYGGLDAGGDTDEDLLYGVQGGYQYDFGNFVVGAEADYNRTNFDLGGGDALDNMARLKGRVGFDAGRAMIYATGGAAFGNATLGGTSYSDTGYFYGAGIDYLVTDQISVGGEITHNQFNEFAGSGTDLDATTFAARVNYKF